LAGLVFGMLRGALLVTLCIVTLAAFFPDTRWLGGAQLARYFLGTAHLTTHITPEELKRKVLDGLHVLERDTPYWLQSK
jgi:membrane protein required for colicin V production